MCEWLPDLITREGDDADGWAKFEEEAYEQFEWDFVESKPSLDGKPVFINLEKDDEKEVSFWHVVTRDYVQTGSRELEPVRAERIAWIRAIIANADKDEVRVWDVERKEGRNRRLLWLHEQGHLVVLNHGNTAWWLVTAYPITEEHTKRKLEKQWQESENG